MKEDTMWRFLFGFGILLEVLSIVAIILWLPHLSLLSLVKEGQDDEAKKLLAHVYKIDHLSAGVKTGVLNKMVKEINDTTEEPQHLSLKEVVTTKTYRAATLNAFMICFLN